MNMICCPFCSKENPPENEVCQYCQARLQPLWVDRGLQFTQDGEDPVDQKGSSAGKEGWRGDPLRLPENNEPVDSGGPTTREPTDWLNGLRNQVSTRDLSPEPYPNDGQRQTEDDFLARIFLGGASPEESDASVSGEGKIDDSSGSLLLERILGKDQYPIEAQPDNDQLVDSAPPESPEQTIHTAFPEIEGSESTQAARATGGDQLDWVEELQSSYRDEEEFSSIETGGEESWLTAEELNLPREEGEELPAWLGEIKARPLEATEAPTQNRDLPKESPPWIDPLQQTEVKEALFDLAGEYNDHVEIAGPLSGLKGILPAEPEIALSRKSGAYLIKHQITETQQMQAQLFDEIIKFESSNPPVPERVLLTSQRIMRVIFAIVILLSVLVPVFSLPLLESMPVISPPEVISASQVISRIDNGAPVLLAVEYEPGYSGELDTALATVIDHLMSRGAYLVLVSTNPNGLIQAEHAIRVAKQAGSHQSLGSPDYQSYVNLGFIPGGQAGLRHFAEHPSQLIPGDVSNEPVWRDPRLIDIHTISDFSLVVVAVENFNKSRAWIEQVGPLMAGAPLIFVNSAQSEPLIRPFFEASPQQVQGFVSGVMGSVQYEATIGLRGIAHLYWPSFNSGLIAAVVLILVGGGANAILALVSSKKERGKGRVLR